MLFRREVGLDDGPELRPEVVAVEPLLVERVRRSVLDEVSEPVPLRVEPLALHHQADGVRLALRRVRDLAGQKKHLR